MYKHLHTCQEACIINTLSSLIHMLMLSFTQFYLYFYKITQNEHIHTYILIYIHTLQNLLIQMNTHKNSLHINILAVKHSQPCIGCNTFSLTHVHAHIHRFSH